MTTKSKIFKCIHDVYLYFPYLNPKVANSYNRTEMKDIKNDIIYILNQKISYEEKFDLISVLSDYVISDILKRPGEYKKRSDVMSWDCASLDDL